LNDIGQVCASCAHYQKPTEGLGLCKRYAPSPKLLSDINCDGDIYDMNDAVMSAAWPVVGADNYCGEWKKWKPELK